jgi:hypothetical protein
MGFVLEAEDVDVLVFEFVFGLDDETLFRKFNVGSLPLLPERLAGPEVELNRAMKSFEEEIELLLLLLLLLVELV